jgi:hypothetical protein
LPAANKCATTGTGGTLAVEYSRLSIPADGVSAWAAGVSYRIGDRVTFGGVVYECRQAHISQSDWTPPATPALWLRL